MPKKSRDKGNRGQRDVAKLLSPWWGADFASTPMSGGFATKRFRDEWNAAADVVTPAEDFPFSVEVKWQEDWILDQLLTSDVCKVWKWWEQCVDEAPEGMIPLLVFKRNRQPWLYMMWTIDAGGGGPEWQSSRHFWVIPPKTWYWDGYGMHQPTVQVGLFDDLLNSEADKWRNRTSQSEPIKRRK